MILSGCKNPRANWPKVETENLEPLREKFPGAIIGNMNLVGSNCSLGTKATLKRSTIGNFCKIADRVKIISSVLIEQDTELQSALEQENDIIFKHICYDGDGDDD